MIDLDLNRVGIPFDWADLFGRWATVDLEVGSGKGKFLLELAAAFPDVGIGLLGVSFAFGLTVLTVVPTWALTQSNPLR